MTGIYQEMLLSEFKKAIVDYPKYGSVSFVAHFHNSKVVRIEHGIVESQKLEADHELDKSPTLTTQEIKKPETPQKLLSIKETATLLRISIATMNRRIKNEEIKVIRIGGRVLISSKEIDRLINGE